MKKYCNSLISYSRFETREVYVGDIPLGGKNPIRIQSMTTTDTMDTIATVEQTIRMVEAGCEYVRITAPSKNEAENLANIKEELKKRGYNVPLIADIHFTPNAAEIAARIVEKVRVNPGNYADKKRFDIIEYSDADYEAELERIRERFLPLVKICKEYGTAMRIGTNHGSLSDRIMSRYGDTPLGMVESAMEFIRICEDENYHDIVLSMKASNPLVMVQAYRLLVNKMIEEGMNYPLHLGVTEAGDGEDGRIKSAVGIGTLLEDGLGDTIRVSLTEEPEKEAPVAIILANRYKNKNSAIKFKEIDNLPYDPFEQTKRKSDEIESIGGVNIPKVIADFSSFDYINFPMFDAIGYNYAPDLDKWNMSDMSADLIYFGKQLNEFPLPQGVKPIYDYSVWQNCEDKKALPLLTPDELRNDARLHPSLNFLKVNLDDILDNEFKTLISDKNICLVITATSENRMQEIRRAFVELLNKEITNPAIVMLEYKDLTQDEFMLYSSTDFGGVFIDGFGDGVWCKYDSNLKLANRTMFGILQAVRARISKTEYIACPSCGRTLFDLVEVTNKIKSKTEHLKGVKIGIMGCIVNGPGEMADADYGYVGSGPGKITLYKGKEVIKRAVPSEKAVDELIQLIKDDGNWQEPNLD